MRALGNPWHEKPLAILGMSAWHDSVEMTAGPSWVCKRPWEGTYSSSNSEDAVPIIIFLTPTNCISKP